MSYAPSKPVEGSEIDAAELRSQFTGLKSLLDAAAVTTAQTQNTTTLNPGQPATASVSFNNGILTFTFGLPEGQPGEVT